ncbi:MAG: YgcG family protein, partial [Burkholderiales bacterium]
MLHKLPRVVLAAVLLCASLIAGGVSADVVIPPLTTRVTDLTATLSSEQRAALENKLAAFEQRKGSQIAVLLMPTTQPEAVEQYSIRVAEVWKLGRKGVDDGVLLLVVKDDRKLRIEVGHGLEGVLPDAITKRIIEETIVPAFKQGNFNDGINAGVDRMIKVIDGEPLPPPEKWRAPSGRNFTEQLDDYMGWGVVLLVFFGGLLRFLFGAFLGALIVGAVGGVIAASLGAGWAISIVVGIVGFVLTLFGVSALSSGGGGS